LDKLRFESDNFLQELNEDQRLNRFSAMQFMAELGSNSDLTRIQS